MSAIRFKGNAINDPSRGFSVVTLASNIFRLTAAMVHDATPRGENCAASTDSDGWIIGRRTRKSFEKGFEGALEGRRSGESAKSFVGSDRPEPHASRLRVMNRLTFSAQGVPGVRGPRRPPDTILSYLPRS